MAMDGQDIALTGPQAGRDSDRLLHHEQDDLAVRGDEPVHRRLRHLGLDVVGDGRRNGRAALAVARSSH